MIKKPKKAVKKVVVTLAVILDSYDSRIGPHTSILRY